MRSQSVTLVLAAVLAALVAPGPPLAAQDPEILITSVPTYGSNGDLAGVANNVDPALHQVCVYLGLEGLGYYIKPFEHSEIPIDPDGSWRANVVTGGCDRYASRYIAFLIEESYTCPNLLGFELPTTLYDNALALDRVVRTPNPIDFAGHTWERRDSRCLSDPGRNLFDPDNVFLDAEGDLHLVIDDEDGVGPECAELYLLDSLGYGRYRVLTRGRFDQLGDWAILGLFTFDPWTQTPFREVDMECGHFGDPLHEDCQYVLQPFDDDGHLMAYSGEFTDGDDERTFLFDWRPGVVDFCTYRGLHPSGDPPVDDQIFCWTHKSIWVPNEGDETFRMNLWAFDRNQIAQDYDVEIVDFAYDPLPALEVTTPGAACPETATLDFSGFTPNAQAVLFRGTAEGTTVIPGGPCAGAELDLADPVRVSVVATDGIGEATLLRAIPVGGCGLKLQVIDAVTCETSNVGEIPAAVP